MSTGVKILLGLVGFFALGFVGCVGIVAVAVSSDTDSQAAVDATVTSAVPEDLALPEESVEVSSDGTSAPVEATSAQEFYQPAVNTSADPDEPFWTTTFELVIPSGAWEPVEVDPTLCKLVAEENYVLTNGSGRPVSLYENGQTLSFDRTGSEVVDGKCIVAGITLGDYESLGDNYQIGNGELTATYTPEEFFLGQGRSSGMPVDGKGRQELLP